MDPVEFDDEDLPVLRTPREIAERCVVLYAVVAAANHEPRDRLMKWLERENLVDAVSPGELEFLTCKRPDNEQMTEAGWRCEALVPLLWAINRLEGLEAPIKQCDVQLIRRSLPPLYGSIEEFVRTAALRDEETIWDVLEDTFQSHWAIHDAVLHGGPVPEQLDRGVVYERHYALNWLTDAEGDEWDDITTDT